MKIYRDNSPHYGVTHVDVIPPQKDNAVAVLKAPRDANRAAAARVTHLDIPITPEKVWQVLKAKGVAEQRSE